jgi:hypothetical protein
MWANAPAAFPHAIACVAAVNVNVNVPLPPPLSRARTIRDSLSKRAAT